MKFFKKIGAPEAASLDLPLLYVYNSLALYLITGHLCAGFLGLTAEVTHIHLLHKSSICRFVFFSRVMHHHS